MDMFAAIMRRQIGAAIDTLEDAMRACPDALWGARLWDDPSAPPGMSDFWYLAYHTLFWLDFYLTGTEEGFAPPDPFTLSEFDPAGLLPDRIYSKDELGSYLDYCRRKRRAETDDLTDDKARRICAFPWGELSYAELLVYSLRHVQEHAAQLHLFLGQQAGLNSRWVAQARGDAAK